MITKDKILLYLALALIIGLGFLHYNLWQENKKLSKHIDETFLKEREANDSIFETYRLDIEALSETNENLQLEINELDRTKQDINKKADEDKDRVNNLASADSLERFFARRYKR